MPGPGAYDSMRYSKYANHNGSKIGKDIRESFFLVDPRHLSADLGSYQVIEFASWSLGAPSFGFGSQVKFVKKDKDHQPGPGSYKIASSIGEKSGTPGYSMPGRRKDLRPKLGVGVPAPNFYTPKDAITSHSVTSFSQSREPKDPNYIKTYPLTPSCTKYYFSNSMDFTMTQSA